MDKKSVRSILEDKIVVPEIQREYVWGDNVDNPEIVRNFVLDVNEKLASGADFPLGFLYSYKHGGELHLIDGQQRMTTIVLLTFYCYCREGCKDASIIQLLNQFSYRVRTDTEDFIFNLLSYAKHFAEDLSLFKKDNLRNSRLFRSKYNGDKTISSMISCLDTIHNLDDQNFKLTCNGVLDGLSFWTFEVGQTSQGEELYISMNSRGEALTRSELLKPRLLENAKGLNSREGVSWGKAWDNWEEMLFSHLGDFTPDKVGEAMNVFLMCVVDIVLGKPRRNISPAEYASCVNLTIIEDYFSALKQLLDSNDTDISKETSSLYDSSKSHLVLKILLAVLYHGEPMEEVSRIFPIIKNWERRGQMKNEDLLRLIHDYQKQQLGWLDFVLTKIDPEQKPEHRQIDGVLNNHEWLKIYRYQKLHNSQLEDLYHKAERDSILHGYIRAVWFEAFESGFEWKEDSFWVFSERLKIFEELFGDDHITIPLSSEPLSSRIDNSLIARAMLAIEPYGIRISGRNYAYGWKNNEKNYWRSLASQTNVARIISRLIDRIYTKEDRSDSSVIETLNSIISGRLSEPETAKYYGKDSGIYYILKYPSSLKAHYHGHNVISFDGDWDNFNIWILEKDNAHSYYFNMFLNILLYMNKGKEGIKKLSPAELELSSGLIMKCSYRQGWDVVYKHWPGDKEKLKKELGQFASLQNTELIDNQTTQKLGQYYIQRGDNDQIILGDKILNFILSYTQE